MTGKAAGSSKTQKLFLALRHRIVTGELESGARLPSEPDLAKQHGISRVTVRRAFDELSRLGLITRRPGAGTFVARTTIVRPIKADLTDALAQLSEMGRNSVVRLIASGTVPASMALARSLGLPDGAPVQRSVRVRMLDGEPFSYLVTHLPDWIAATFSAADLASTPLLSLIERSGVRVHRASQILSATLASPQIAEALGTDVGGPLLTLTRVVFALDGRAVEHLEAYYRPDRYAFGLEMVRSGRQGARRWAAQGAGRGTESEPGPEGQAE